MYLQEGAQVGLLGPPDVERLEAEGDVAGLIDAIAQGDTAVRRAATKALGRVRDPRAIGALMDALGDRDVVLRLNARDALVAIGAQAIDPLVARLTDRLVEERVRKACADALHGLDWQPEESEAGAFYWSARREWAKCVELETAAVGPLAALVIDPQVERRVRMAAAEGLGRIRDGRAAAALAVGLTLADKELRQAVGKALVGLRELAAQPLIAMLADRELSVDIRFEVAAVLGRLGRPAVEPLLAVLQDPDSFVRGCAATVLGKIGDVSAVEPLKAALNDKEESVRREAAEALRRIGNAIVVHQRAATSETDGTGPRRPAAVEPAAAGLRDVDDQTRKARLGILSQQSSRSNADEIGAATPRSEAGHKDVFVPVSSDCSDLHDDSVTGYWR